MPDPMSMSLRHQPLTELEEVLVRLVDARQLSSEQIAAQLDVTVSHVGQLYRNAKARQQDFAAHGADALSRLPERAQHLLQQLGLHNRAETRSAIESGRLSWSGSFQAIVWDGRFQNYYGPKTWRVLLEWTELPVPADF